jgi:hypothetical protein
MPYSSSGPETRGRAALGVRLNEENEKMPNIDATPHLQAAAQAIADAARLCTSYEPETAKGLLSGFIEALNALAEKEENPVTVGLVLSFVAQIHYV